MPELSALLLALSTSEPYPHHPQHVELIQTRISAVFLAGDYVYKVKKPVCLDFLDFTTLDKRYFYCQQEVMLNKRLCPRMYLGVVPITEDGGEFRIEGEGNVIEYAVKMLRLPHGRMMNRLLDNGRITPWMVEKVASKLAEFHKNAQLNEQLAIIGGIDTVTRNNMENMAETEPYVGNTISLEQYERIKNYNYSFLIDNAWLFVKRVADGRIRDCHGDLHTEHICFTNGLCIYDCIEFNDRFRYIDVASEVAFLAMDLDFHGYADLSKDFVNAYVQASGDEESLELLDFYKCYRACVRGKVESFELGDADILQDEKERASAIARRYFMLADYYACEAYN